VWAALLFALRLTHAGVFTAIQLGASEMCRGRAEIISFKYKGSRDGISSIHTPSEFNTTNLGRVWNNQLPNHLVL